MSESTGIVLTATGISFANDWYNGSSPNLRIVVAGLGVCLLFDGIEKVNKQAAVGLSVIMLITVLVTPIRNKAPFQTVETWLSPTTESKVK